MRIKVGWNDELNRPSLWEALAMENRAKVDTTTKGALNLSLGHVPEGWPYEYQWSGVSREAKVDIGKFPVLSAWVSQVSGYAHLDVDVIDAAGKPVKTLRSSTLTSPGVSNVDLRQGLDPAVYRLRLRLIVGGPNDGCSATYNWVRFTDPKAAEFLNSHPDWQYVIPEHLWGFLR